MSPFERIRSALISSLPSLVPAILGICFAWNQSCDEFHCKTISVIIMLTGVVLLIWSVIVFAAVMMLKDPGSEADEWKRFRQNLGSVTPRILLYAAWAGCMFYITSRVMLQSLDITNYREDGKLVLIAVFGAPVYELTRLFEREESLAAIETIMTPPAFNTRLQRICIYLQSLAGFSIWVFMLTLLLPLPDSISSQFNAGWRNIVVIGVVLVFSLGYTRLLSALEKIMRKKGLVMWNSKY